MSPQQLHNTTAAAVHRIIRFMDPWVQGGPIKVWLVPFWEDRCTVRKYPMFFTREENHWIRTIQTKSWPKTQNTVTLITCFFKFIWGCRVYYQVIFSLHSLISLVRWDNSWVATSSVTFASSRVQAKKLAIHDLNIMSLAQDVESIPASHTKKLS